MDSIQKPAHVSAFDRQRGTELIEGAYQAMLSQSEKTPGPCVMNLTYVF